MAKDPRDDYVMGEKSGLVDESRVQNFSTEFLANPKGLNYMENGHRIVKFANFKVKDFSIALSVFLK